MATTKTRGDELALAERLATLFGQSGKRVFRAVSRALEQRGEQVLEWKMLAYLDKEGPAAQREIACAAALDPAGVSRLLEDLEAQGFVRRRRDAHDRRKFSVELTARGRARVVGSRDVALSAVDHAIRGLTRTDRLQLAALLEKIVAVDEERLVAVGAR